MSRRQSRSPSKQPDLPGDQNPGSPTKKRSSDASKSPVKKKSSGIKSLNPESPSKRWISDTNPSQNSSRRSSRVARTEDGSAPPTRSGGRAGTATSNASGSSSKSGSSNKENGSAGPTRNITQAEIDRETHVLAQTEKQLEILKKMADERNVVLDKLLKELQRMHSVLNKAKEVKEEVKMQVNLDSKAQSELRKQQIEARKELLEKGPFNLIFHGVEPDWVEQEMADDPEFRRDVVEHRIKTLIREGMGITRDVGIIDCYRYYEGAQYKDSFPIVVTFKARREKEQMLWRSKDKLRKQDIVVTDDSAERIEAERAIKEGRTPPRSPVKSKAKVPEIKQPEQDLFADFF